MINEYKCTITDLKIGEVFQYKIKTVHGEEIRTALFLETKDNMVEAVVYQKDMAGLPLLIPVENVLKTNKEDFDEYEEIN